MSVQSLLTHIISASARLRCHLPNMQSLVQYKRLEDPAPQWLGLGDSICHIYI